MSKLALVATLLAASTAAAQSPAPAPAASPVPAASPAPALPKPAAELERLGFLVGDWIHSENFHPSPMGPGGKGGARSKTSRLLGDHHLYVTYVSKNPMGTVEGRGFLGWDPEKKAYRMHWFDNMGLATVYTGNFDAAGNLVLDSAYSYEGKPVKERFTIKKQPDGNVLFESSMAGPDGTYAVVMESMASPAPKK